MIKIAIIDTIGLTYDGTTLDKRGLGGSESAVILMAKELSKIGFQVTVFNNCIDKEASPGVYDGVEYIDHTTIPLLTDTKFDVVISSRAVGPFVPEEYYPNFQWPMSAEIFKDIKRNAGLKIVWLHDTFCTGDFLLEFLLVNGHIDEIFTLSDFHTSYVTNCDHGQKRMFEVLKNKIFMTRNGVTKYHNFVDISKKDPNLFVYNSSVTKGMIPLVTKIWERIKTQNPSAQLKIIGGYYRFRENLEPDEQEKTWRNLANDSLNSEKGIEFTGIIKQSEIADILSKASYMIYPGAFPETFGISTLESLVYNTPLITTRFGALEETAIDKASYFIDYPIEPNSLFPHINTEDQENKFVDMTLRALSDPYLHQQKMYYCNILKDICTWDTIALQWKQHLYKKLGKPLSVEEYRNVCKINSRVHEVYGRRFSNIEEFYIPRQSKQQKIVIITPVFNAESYIGNCIDSIITQDYENWELIIIDDCSSDNTVDIVRQYSDPRIILICNENNEGAVYNQIKSIHQFCDNDDIIMLIDGDDWLVNNNQIFHFYNNLYDGTTEFTYGSCWSLADNIPLIAQPYPENIKKEKAYRKHLFNWNMPYTHLRTFKKYLLDSVNINQFKDEDGNWYKAGGDGSIFYSLIEVADYNKVKVVQDIMYCYNDKNPLNDYKINGEQQTKNAKKILKQHNNFAVIIPTMWRCQDIFERSLNEIVKHPLVDEIFIINNEQQSTPDWSVLKNKKISILNMPENCGVNPAWNLGVEKTTAPKLCFLNDDIEFDTKLFDRIYDRIIPSMGTHGIIWGKEEYNQPITTDGSINFKEWVSGDVIHCFGQLFFVHRANWVPIDTRLKVFFGDDWIFHNHLLKGLKNYLIYNTNFNTRHASTGTSPDMIKFIDDSFKNEKPIFEKWFHENPLNIEKQMKEKTILIAVPTNKYIEPETFKSIYDQILPEGYKADFQFFYGYQIDQIRNLIANWASRYDYLFSVDSDISFESDTLKKLIESDKDIISGLYIQRIHEKQNLEIYKNGRLKYEDIIGKGIIEIDSCGFGCVLIKSDIIRSLDYPHFVYKSAIDHKNTLSEDTYFCEKAKEKGYSVWADTSILCKHHGSTTFEIKEPQTNIDNEQLKHLRVLKGFQNLFPVKHINYLNKMKNDGIEPKIIYDIGACILHWTHEARKIWTDASIIAFDAMPETEVFCREENIPYNIGILSDVDNKEVTFYRSTEHPGGNSYYKENSEINERADEYFTNIKTLKATTLDTVVRLNNFPYPDLIKMDVQGAELDVIKGAKEVLKTCKDLILELQTVEYNKGAPLKDEVIQYLNSIGFVLINNDAFCINGPDGDYHFRNIKRL